VPACVHAPPPQASPLHHTHQVARADLRAGSQQVLHHIEVAVMGGAAGRAAAASAAAAGGENTVGRGEAEG
jgi:hypothetical protein